MPDSTRIKVFNKTGTPYAVYISEACVSDYEGHFDIVLNNSSQFVEMEGSISIGDPDVHGAIRPANGGPDLIKFAACNKAFVTPYFSWGGTDGMETKQYLLENQSRDFTYGGINCTAARISDGDGCKLFEFYLQSNATE